MQLFPITILFLSTLLSCSSDSQKKTSANIMTSSTKVALPTTQKRTAIIYHSADGGLNWTPFDNGIQGDATVSAFLIFEDKIFASTDSHGIYFIHEGQVEWKRMDENLPDDIDINAISAINNVLVIGTFSHGTMTSKDNGKNWSYPRTRINSPIRCLHIKENMLFAGADNGIYKSLDDGNTWDHIWKGVQVNGFTEMSNQIYAALMNGVLATNDNGKTWKYVYEPHTLHDISTDGQNIYAMTLGAGLKKSGNAGLTWDNANSGLGTMNLYTFEVKRFANKLYAAQWYGIYTSDIEAINWKLIKNGLPDSTAFTTLETTKAGLIAGIGLRKK